MSTAPPAALRRFLDRALSRRALLGVAPVAGAATLAGCAGADRRQDVGGPDPAAHDHRQSHGEADDAHGHHGPPPGYHFFTVEELHALESLTPRLVTDAAGVTGAMSLYVDRKLTASVGGEAPVAGLPPGTESARPVGTPLHPREVYHLGMPSLDRYSQTRFGAVFADLPQDRQDDVVGVLEATARQGAGEGHSSIPRTHLDQAESIFDGVHPALFVQTVRADLTEGMSALHSHHDHAGDRPAAKATHV